MWTTFVRSWIGPRDYLCVDCGMGFMLDEKVYIDVSLSLAHHKECMTPGEFHNLMSNHPSIIGPNKPDRPLSLQRRDIEVVQFVRMLRSTRAGLITDISDFPDSIKIHTNGGFSSVKFTFNTAGQLISIATICD
jgi:hypothetical protein